VPDNLYRLLNRYECPSGTGIDERFSTSDSHVHAHTYRATASRNGHTRGAGNRPVEEGARLVIQDDGADRVTREGRPPENSWIGRMGPLPSRMHLLLLPGIGGQMKQTRQVKQGNIAGQARRWTSRRICRRRSMLRRPAFHT
jgi:hypothetical protein